MIEEFIYYFMGLIFISVVGNAIYEML